VTSTGVDGVILRSLLLLALGVSCVFARSAARLRAGNKGLYFWWYIPYALGHLLIIVPVFGLTRMFAALLFDRLTFGFFPDLVVDIMSLVAGIVAVALAFDGLGHLIDRYETAYAKERQMTVRGAGPEFPFDHID
jgi:hypothetical protein